MALWMLGWPVGQWIGHKTLDTPMARLMYASMNYDAPFIDNVIMTFFSFSYALGRELLYNTDDFVMYHGDKFLDIFSYTPPEPWHELYEDRMFGDYFVGDDTNVDRIFKY